MSDTTKPNSKFYLVAQPEGHYTGSIQLPTGTKYGFPNGRGLYPNTGRNGEWYRGDVIALNHDRFAADARIDAAKKPEGLDERSTLKPLEIRLNNWTGGKANLIGNLWTSEGLFTIFADKAVEKGQLVLKGSIKLARPAAPAPDAGAERTTAPAPDTDAARANAQARVDAAAAPQPPKPEQA